MQLVKIGNCEHVKSRLWPLFNHLSKVFLSILSLLFLDLKKLFEGLDAFKSDCILLLVFVSLFKRFLSDLLLYLLVIIFQLLYCALDLSWAFLVPRRHSATKVLALHLCDQLAYCLSSHVCLGCRLGHRVVICLQRCQDSVTCTTDYFSMSWLTIHFDLGCLLTVYFWLSTPLFVLILYSLKIERLIDIYECALQVTTATATENIKEN